jgi:hypothetical protein
VTGTLFEDDPEFLLTQTDVPGFDDRHYVPILLTRQGERLALRELDAALRTAFTPLFVAHPVPDDPKTEQPKCSVEEHLLDLARSLSKEWHTPAFVDLRHVDTSSPMSDGSHALRFFIARCREAGLALVPAISGDHDDSYREAARVAADENATGVMLRLSPAEWSELGTPVGDGELEKMIALTGRSADELHLMLDLQDQIAETAALTARALRPVLDGLPHMHEWLSVTIAGTGMPSGTAEVGRDGAMEIARREWSLWRALRGVDGRKPTFGDYGVQHPDPISNFNPLYMDSSAQLRYTIASAWFVVRGQGMKVLGAGQIRGLAEQVVAHGEFAGADFSFGDTWLDAVSKGSADTASQGYWRKVTTNHHLTYVVRQLATLFGT